MEKSNRELQTFAYISSHDLQEPLRKIQTFATLLAEKESANLSPEGIHYFLRLRSSAERMQLLINDLLLYSRTTGSENIFSQINLQNLVNEIKEELFEEITQNHATVEVTKSCDLKVIPYQFRQLLYNFISNAIKFKSPERDLHIKISCGMAPKPVTGMKSHQKYMEFCFEDNGIGFDQQYAVKIFELFQRLHKREEYEGTGIGLSIVKKIVDNHHGVIFAKSAIGKGTAFYIYFPV